MDATGTVWLVRYGLVGYGPEGENATPADTLEGLADVLCDELSRAADRAHETAHTLADAGEYESAWGEIKRSEGLAILSANFDPARASAPLYAGDPAAWRATIERMVAESFPCDVGEYERLYVWEGDADEWRDEA
jgi:hypothetical protein